MKKVMLTIASVLFTLASQSSFATSSMKCKAMNAIASYGWQGGQVTEISQNRNQPILVVGLYGVYLSAELKCDDNGQCFGVTYGSIPTEGSVSIVNNEIILKIKVLENGLPLRIQEASFKCQ